MFISPPHPARVLVTGATGFVGRHLVHHLHADGWEVAVLTRAQSEPTDASVQSFLYTGQTSEVMRAVADFQPVTVFHLASLFLVQHTPDQIEPLVSSNILLGTQLLEAMRAAGIHSLVNAGTAWQNFAGDAYLPVNLYAATKQAFELESPFSVLIRSNYTALQRSGKTNAAILVEKQSDSVPLWTRPRNQEPSLSISQTLFPPPFSSAI